MATNIREKGAKYCLNHLKEEVTFLCETCKVLICNKCITTAAHRGHTLVDLDTAVQTGYNKLQDFNSNTLNVTIPDIEDKAEKANAIFQAVEKEIFSRIKLSQDQGLYLKTLVDAYMTSTQNEYKEMLTVYQKKHKMYQLESRDALKKLDNFMKENTSASKSDNNVLIIDLANDSSRQINFDKFQLQGTIPNFIPSSEPEKHLQDAFGYIEDRRAEAKSKHEKEVNSTAKGASGGTLTSVPAVQQSTTTQQYKLKEITDLRKDYNKAKATSRGVTSTIKRYFEDLA